MKVWITKYVLTEGIIEGNGEVSTSTPNSDLFVCEKTGHWANYAFPYFHGEGKEWHRTEDAAKVRANAMVAAKIKNLKKSLAKFEKMVF